MNWKFWQKKKLETVLDPNWRDLSDHDKYSLVLKFGCLVCEDNPDFMMYEGPSGGMSQNIWCSVCGTRWNMSIFPQNPRSGVAELVTEREREEEFNGQ